MESFSSLYSTLPEKGDYVISGEVLFGVEYVEGKLLVHINSARDIAAANKGGKSDPYIKTYLLPDKKKETKKKTKVVKKSLNPVYNETLKVTHFLIFPLSYSPLWFTTFYLLIHFMSQFSFILLLLIFFPPSV